MRRVLVLLTTAVLLPLAGQNAKVIILGYDDTARLQTAYSEMLAARQNWEKIRGDVAKSYVEGIKGWEEVEFSRDFRVMVPVQPLQAAWISGGPSWGSAVLQEKH